MEDRKNRIDQHLDEHDERLKRYDTFIEQHADLIRKVREKHDKPIEVLKLTHDIAMVGFLRDQGETEKAVVIENKYVRDFVKLFYPRKK